MSVEPPNIRFSPASSQKGPDPSLDGLRKLGESCVKVGARLQRTSPSEEKFCSAGRYFVSSEPFCEGHMDDKKELLPLVQVNGVDDRGLPRSGAYFGCRFEKKSTESIISERLNGKE